MKHLQDVFFSSAIQYPNKIALICDKNYWSYEELLQKINALAREFSAKKVSKNNRIVIQSGNTVDTVIAFWATLIMGAIAIIIDPNLDTQKLNYILQDADAKVHFRSIANYNIREISNESITHPQDLAAIIYTTGSTGIPKGVMLSHNNMLTAAFSINQYLNHTSSDKALSVLPMSFDYGLYQMIMMFSVGGTLVLEKDALFPGRILYKIESEKCTILPCVPTLINLLFEHSQYFHYDYSSLRAATNTGAALNDNHIRKIKTLFPSSQLFSMFGLTECKRCTYLPPQDLERKPNSIGIAIPNIELQIVNNQNELVKPGVIGQLVVRGPAVMQGYWNNPKATAIKLKDGALYTGDLVWADDENYYYFAGRMDDIIKHKGMKISLLELENKIAQDKNVADVAVVTIETKIIACISLQTATTLTLNDLSPIDKIITFKFLPKNTNGKIDKTILKSWICGS